MSEEGSSSSASSVEGDIITTSSEDETSYNHISMSDSTCSDEKNIYGFDPARFEEDVGTQDMYQRYDFFMRPTVVSTKCMGRKGGAYRFAFVCQSVKLSCSQAVCL
jgi:hypothetical protein